MSQIVIRARNLSKQYRIPVTGELHDTLRDQLTEGFKAWFHRNGKRSSPRNGITVFSALKGVSFDVKEGEVVGLIGRNGAGKSTLLKLLSQITKPSSGRAEIHGRVGSLLEVGTGFSEELSGRENIYLNGAILGMKKAEIDDKFDEIVAFAEVEDFIDVPVKRYSSGMYMRLAFAVAAHLEPEILLVDEVLAVGDAAFQRKCLGKIDAVSKGGRTVLFVSHNMAMIENLCPRTIFLSHGQVAGDGSTHQVIDRYLKELSELSSISLAERTDRIGRGEIRICAIEFLDPRGNKMACAASGEEFVIRVHYYSKTTKVFPNCRVSVSVHKDERPYFLMSTELVDNRQLDLRGGGYIDFVLPELPLSAGKYTVDPFIEANKVIQDWINRGASFSVVDGDFYGTGRNYPKGWQGKCVLVKYQWKQNNCTAGV